jgi:hypothetical protein
LKDAKKIAAWKSSSRPFRNQAMPFSKRLALPAEDLAVFGETGAVVFNYPVV